MDLFTTCRIGSDLEKSWPLLKNFYARICEVQPTRNIRKRGPMECTEAYEIQLRAKGPSSGETTSDKLVQPDDPHFKGRAKKFRDQRNVPAVDCRMFPLFYPSHPWQPS